MYLNKYGIFYEGQILEQYYTTNNMFYYSEDVILKKIIVHYDKNRNIRLSFRVGNLYNKVEYTLNNIDMLGTYYRIKRKN